MARDPYQYFRPEARELLEQFSRVALEMEKGSVDRSHIQLLLRLAHTLKGAARVVKQPEIAATSHAIEDLFAPHEKTSGDLPPGLVGTLQAHLGQIGQRLLALTPAESEASASAPVADAKSVGAELPEIDNLLNRLSEVNSSLSALRPAIRGIEYARELANLLIEQSASVRKSEGSNNDALGRVRTTQEELGRSFDGLARTIGSTLERMDRELKLVRDSADRLRLAPAADGRKP